MLLAKIRDSASQRQPVLANSTRRGLGVSSAGARVSRLGREFVVQPDHACAPQPQLVVGARHATGWRRRSAGHFFKRAFSVAAFFVLLMSREYVDDLKQGPGRVQRALAGQGGRKAALGHG